MAAIIRTMNTLRALLLAGLSLLAGTVAHAQDFQTAVDASRRGDYATALEIWTALAEEGDTASQFNLAMMYVRGDGVARDLATAAQWFRKAAELGLVSAQARLGTMYAHGQGVEQDYGEAARWLYQAAEAKDGPSQYDLAVLYANGSGVEQDYSAAYYWFTMSTIQGFAPAQEAQTRLRGMLPQSQIGYIEQLIQSRTGLGPPAE
jgi:hypothetical protein